MRKRKQFQQARPLVNGDLYRLFTALSHIQGLNPRVLLNYLMAKWINMSKENIDQVLWFKAIGEDLTDSYVDFVEVAVDCEALGKQFTEEVAPVLAAALDPWMEEK